MIAGIASQPTVLFQQNRPIAAIEASCKQPFVSQMGTRSNCSMPHQFRVNAHAPEYLVPLQAHIRGGVLTFPLLFRVQRHEKLIN